MGLSCILYRETFLYLQYIQCNLSTDIALQKIRCFSEGLVRIYGPMADRFMPLGPSPSNYVDTI